MKSYPKMFLSALVALLALCATGCHTVSPALKVDQQALSGKKHIYVVQSTGKERGFKQEIERNLSNRGFTVNWGPLEGVSADAELYLVYEDKWAWDFVMYPSQVKMALYDARTRKLLGSDEFKNSFFHTFPDPPEITDELLGRIFGEPAGSHMQ